MRVIDFTLWETGKFNKSNKTMFFPKFIIEGITTFWKTFRNKSNRSLLLLLAYNVEIVFKMLYKATSKSLIVGTLQTEPFVKHLLNVFRGYACCLFHTNIRRHHYRWRVANFDLKSRLTAIEQWGFFSVPYLL